MVSKSSCLIACTVGLAIFKLPGIFSPPENLSATGSVVLSVLGAIALLAVLGIRYPLKMLPLEFLWYTQQLAPEARDILINCLVGIVLVPLVMPWGYVFKQYVKARGDPWGKRVTVSTSTSVARDTGRT
jgi:hypothetical protein